MAQVAAPLLIMQAGAGGLSAYSSYKSGEAKEKELKFAKQQEFIGAKEREIQRNDRLLDALASQNVQAGAGGVKLEGTPLDIMMADAKRAKDESDMDALQTRIRTLSLDAQAAASKRMGRTQALATLMSTGADMYQTGDA